MTTSLTLEITLNDKNYCQITIDNFQKYVNKDFEGTHLWKAIKIDLRFWTKKDWEAINATTWIIIEQYYIPFSVCINHY